MQAPKRTWRGPPRNNTTVTDRRRTLSGAKAVSFFNNSFSPLVDSSEDAGRSEKAGPNEFEEHRIATGPNNFVVGAVTTKGLDSTKGSVGGKRKNEIRDTSTWVPKKSTNKGKAAALTKAQEIEQALAQQHSVSLSPVRQQTETNLSSSQDLISKDNANIPSGPVKSVSKTSVEGSHTVVHISHPNKPPMTGEMEEDQVSGEYLETQLVRRPVPPDLTKAFHLKTPLKIRSTPAEIKDISTMRHPELSESRMEEDQQTVTELILKQSLLLNHLLIGLNYA